MPDHRMIPLSKPDLSQREEDLVIEAMRSGRLSIGPMVERFEQLVAERVGCGHAVAVNSGTSGLHLALLALGIGPGDEVITTPFSFVASANCILFVGAKPVFVDIDPRSLNMDPQALEAAITPRTKAVLAVETFGNPAHMDTYARICARHEIHLIEDCCEALGVKHRGRAAGTFGRVGVFGFYPNKQITTGEGGMIVTDDARLADCCRSLRNQGRPVSQVAGQAAGSWLAHERMGFNFRLSDINAAVGVGQMERFDAIVSARRNVATMYMQRLMGASQVVLPTVEPETEQSWFVFVIRLVTGYTDVERDRIIQGLRNHDVGAAPYFPCIHLQQFYREKFGFKTGQFPIAESVSQRTIAIPFYGSLTRREVDLVAQTLEVMIAREHLSRA
ncbi:MAG: DegT/DnrJ/EryC1/StrS family aminotransferase [Phycisphaeraceae bacterium]|nr:DegT/DnrJ/EryC1/StrS family aminotransferase [Phycisphaeraceae bacterium]MCW5764198.1 DegT/DnrJ/EryC1/StrS family aminotransferase [Phycisphaeraceae bacterium]